MRYWFREWLKLKILTKIKVSGNMELEVSCTMSENVNGTIWRNVLAVSYQLKHTPTSFYYKEIKHMSTQRVVYKYSW